MSDNTPQIESMSKLAHELRTPLNAIVGFTQVLLSEIDGPVTDEQREDLKIIQAAGQRLRSLLSSLLDFWEVSLQPLRLELEPQSVRVLLERITGEVAGLRVTTTRTPLLRLEVREMQATLDGHRLHRTLVALADAMLRRQELECLEVFARKRHAMVEIVFHEKGGHLGSDDELKVIEIEELANEAPAALMRLWPLTLAKRVVEAHHGSISIAWLEGEGYEVTLRLPASPGDTAPDETPVPASGADLLRSKVLGAMGHELKNPLNSITGFSDMLSAGAEGSLNEEQLKSLRIVRSSSEQLLRLTSAVVDNARLEAGALTLRREWVAPNDLVKDAVSMVRLRASGIAMHTEADPKLPSLHVDRDRTVNALAALASMTIEATRQPISIIARPYRFSSDDTALLEFDISGNKDATVSEQRDFASLLEEQAPAVDSLGLEVSVARRVLELQGGRVWHETGSAGAFRVCLTLPTGA